MSVISFPGTQALPPPLPSDRVSHIQAQLKLARGALRASILTLWAARNATDSVTRQELLDELAAELEVTLTLTEAPL